MDGAAILGATRRPGSGQRARRPPDARRRRVMRCEPCSRSPTAAACRTSLATWSRWASSSCATDGTREALAAEGIEVRQHRRPDRHAAARRRPGQDVPPRRSTPASWPAATGPSSSTELAEQGIGALRHRGRQRAARSRRRSARGVVPIDEAHRDDRRRRPGAARPRRRATTPAWPRSPIPPTTRRSSRSCAITATSRPSSASAWRPRRSRSSPPTTPRWPPTSTTSRGTRFPRRPDARAREAARPALRREPAPARRRSTARRRTAPARSPTRRRLQGADADLQRPARPRRGVPHRVRLHGPHRAASSSSANPVGLASADDARSTPTSGRSRATRSTPSARSSASTATSTRRRPSAHRGQRLRGGRGARLSTTRPCASWPRSRSWPC